MSNSEGKYTAFPDFLRQIFRWECPT